MTSATRSTRLVGLLRQSRYKQQARAAANLWIPAPATRAAPKCQGVPFPCGNVWCYCFNSVFTVSDKSEETGGSRQLRLQRSFGLSLARPRARARRKLCVSVESNGTAGFPDSISQTFGTPGPPFEFSMNRDFSSASVNG